MVGAQDSVDVNDQLAGSTKSRVRVHAIIVIVDDDDIVPLAVVDRGARVRSPTTLRIAAHARGAHVQGDKLRIRTAALE